MRQLGTGAKPPLKSGISEKTALCLDAASWEGGLAFRHETRDRDIWQKRGAAQRSGGAGSGKTCRIGTWAAPPAPYDGGCRL